MRAVKGKHGTEILLGALGDPGGTVSLGLVEWDLLLRVARGNRLLGRLAVCLEEEGLLERLPPKVVEHLRAARVFVDYRQRMARWEVNRMLQVLEGLDVPLVLLKGSAYILAGLPAARGRLLSDVDFMVPSTALERVEETLLASGWEGVKLEEYD